MSPVQYAPAYRTRYSGDAGFVPIVPADEGKGNNKEIILAPLPRFSLPSQMKQPVKI